MKLPFFVYTTMTFYLKLNSSNAFFQYCNVLEPNNLIPIKTL